MKFETYIEADMSYVSKLKLEPQAISKMAAAAILEFIINAAISLLIDGFSPDFAATSRPPSPN
jgi:hypothetical protein